MAPEPGMMTEAVSPVAPCVAWRCGNKDECNREEGNCCYPSHFYLTTTRMVDPRQIGVKRRLGSVGFETDKEIKSVSASTLSEEYAAKWVELLKEVVPRASLVALLWNPKNMHAARAKAVQDAAKALRVKLESFEGGGLAGKRDGDALLLCSVTDLPGCSRGRRGPNPARLRTPDPTGVSGHEGGNSDEYNGRRQRQGVQPMRPDGVTDEPGEEPCDSDGSRDDCNGVQTVAPHLLGRGG